MAKWHGKVGYVTSVETEPNVWEMKPIEKHYYGDLIRNTSRWTPSGNVNDNLTVSSQISIVADPFAYENVHTIKYVELMGSMWEVTSIEPQYPRILLTLGGVYNGERA